MENDERMPHISEKCVYLHKFITSLILQNNFRIIMKRKFACLMLLVAFGLSSPYSYAAKATNEKNDIQKSVANSNNEETFFMKGDTLVYNPDAFIVREGASILEKISRFPGVSIDSNGILCVNGKGTNVLVDGKEVFSSLDVLEKIPAYMVASAQVYERVPEDVRGTTLGRSVDKETVMNIQLKKSHQNVWTGELEGGVGVSFVDDGSGEKVNPYEGSVLGLRSGEKSRVMVKAGGNKTMGCGSLHDSQYFTNSYPTSATNMELNGLYQINKESRYQGSLSLDYDEGAGQEFSIAEDIYYSFPKYTLSSAKTSTYVKSLSTTHEFKYSKNDEVLGLLQNPTLHFIASLDLNKNIQREEDRAYNCHVGVLDPLDSLYSDAARHSLYKTAQKRNSLSMSGYAMASPIGNDKIDIALRFGYLYYNQNNDRYSYNRHYTRSYEPYTSCSNSGNVGLDLSFALDDSKKNMIRVGDDLKYSSLNFDSSSYYTSYSWDSKGSEWDNLDLYPIEYTNGIPFRSKSGDKTDVMTHNLSLNYSYNNYNQQTGGDVLFKAGIEMPVINETFKRTTEVPMQDKEVSSYDGNHTNFAPFVSYRYKNNKKAMEYYLIARFTSAEASISDIVRFGEGMELKNSLTYNFHAYGKKRFGRTFVNAYVDYNRYDNRLVYYFNGYSGYVQRNGTYRLGLHANVDAPLTSTEVLRLKNTITYNREKTATGDDYAYDKIVTENLRLVFQPSSSLELSAIGALHYIGQGRKYSSAYDSDIYAFDYGLAANIELPFGIQFGTDCMMRSTRGYDDEAYNRNAFVLNARLTKRFINNRLLVQFTGYDIFDNVCSYKKEVITSYKHTLNRTWYNIPSYGMMNVTWRF